MLNRENFLQKIDVTQLGGWTKVKNHVEIEKVYKFPQLEAKDFHQLAEISHGIHPILKGIQCASHIRKKELENWDGCEIDNFEEYEEAIRECPSSSSVEIYVKRLDRRPKGYYRLEVRNLLPPWPGMTFNILIIDI